MIKALSMGLSPGPAGAPPSGRDEEQQRAQAFSVKLLRLLPWCCCGLRLLQLRHLRLLQLLRLQRLLLLLLQFSIGPRGGE